VEREAQPAEGSGGEDLGIKVKIHKIRQNDFEAEAFTAPKALLLSGRYFYGDKE
jgi:hypothetical protein